jgi:hypothetical protein
MCREVSMQRRRAFLVGASVSVGMLVSECAGGGTGGRETRAMGAADGATTRGFQRPIPPAAAIAARGVRRPVPRRGGHTRSHGVGATRTAGRHHHRDHPRAGSLRAAASNSTAPDCTVCPPGNGPPSGPARTKRHTERRPLGARGRAARPHPGAGCAATSVVRTTTGWPRSHWQWWAAGGTGAGVR